jgi:hypothetical protein
MNKEFEYIPDDLTTAHEKVKREVPDAAELLEKVTKPVDHTVTIALFLDPFLRRLQAKSKTMTERAKFKKKKEA